MREGGGPSFSADDIFSQFFGGGFFGMQGFTFVSVVTFVSGGGGGGRGRGQSRQRKGEDLVHPLKVSLEDLYKGKTTKLSLQKHVLCGDCGG